MAKGDLKVGCSCLDATLAAYRNHVDDPLHKYLPGPEAGEFSQIRIA